MITQEKKYLKPSSVEEAIRIAGQNAGHFRYLAGGTDILVNRFQGNVATEVLIDITGIDELKKVVVEGDYLKIGSLVTLDSLKKYDILHRHFPSLLLAAYAATSPMLRKTATIGGNMLCENRCSFYNQSEWWREAVGYCLKCDGDVCIATGGTKACFSKFVSDTAPVLISMDAEIVVADSSATVTIPLETIYTGDGIHPRNLSPTSIITNILLPLNQEFKTVFKKLRPREAVDFTSLTTAVSINQNGRIKLAIGGVDPKPVVLEGELNGSREEYIKLALKKCRVVDNDFYSRKYRREMIRVFLEQSFDELQKTNR